MDAESEMVKMKAVQRVWARNRGAGEGVRSQAKKFVFLNAWVRTKQRSRRVQGFSKNWLFPAGPDSQACALILWYLLTSEN